MRRVVAAAFVVLLPARALAQGAPQMQVEADQDTVGVGDVVKVEMSATSGDTMPSDPQPGAIPGFTLRGQSASPAQTHISINGHQIDRYTLTVDWSLQAQKTGTYSIGPATVVVGGARFAGHPVKVRVVPAGQAPARSPQPQPMQMQQFPFGFSPFDPWRGLIPGANPNDRPAAPAPAPTTDPKLSLDAPRGKLYFLHATADKGSAVVGEQVTFSVYDYTDTDLPGIEASDEHDAQAPDFVKRSLLRDDQGAVLAGYASVGGRTWVVKLVQRWALFPLYAGDLSIGPMTLGLAGPRPLAGSTRTTEALRIYVSEPPLLGRPPGYALGDVGRFTLTAQVQPRQVEQGGAVGVHVELSGRGNIPSALAGPAQQGVEWLTPEVHEQVGPIGHEAFGGKKSFDYVVRLHRAGEVDLGELALPFWDPDQKRYEVARARLGAVSVSRSAGASGAAPPEPQETLPGLPAARDTLEGLTAPRRHADDAPVFWMAGVAAWPLLFGASVAARSAGRRAVEAWRRRRDSAAAELKERILAAHAACRAEDPRTADAAIARALEAAAVAHAGVSVRDAVGGEVEQRLERRGVPHGAAARVAELLRECEAARFAPDAADVVAARERWQRAQGAIRNLEKRG